MRRVDGLREDQEEAGDDKEEKVKEQESPEKQEVGEHAGSESSAQFLHGWMPQPEGAEDGEAAEQTVAPRLRGEKHAYDWRRTKKKCFPLRKILSACDKKFICALNPCGNM